MPLQGSNGVITETTPQPDDIQEFTVAQTQEMVAAIDAQITELQQRKSALEAAIADAT